MGIDIEQSEIAKLEDILVNFKKDWDQEQKIRASKWRYDFLLSFFVAIVISLTLSLFWWLNIVVISYFAASLFLMIRQRSIVYQRLTEYQKQLKLVRFLNGFKTSAYSKKLINESGQKKKLNL